MRIIGHADSTGSDAINNPLQRILIDRRGSHEPIADNNTEFGRAKNRHIGNRWSWVMVG